MLNGIAPAAQPKTTRPDWRVAFRAATHEKTSLSDPYESEDQILQHGGKLTANRLGLLIKTRVVAGYDAKDENHDGIDDKEENHKNDGFLSELQNQKLFEGIYNGLIRPDTLSHNKQGYLAHDGVNLTLAHKQEIEDKHKVCLAGRTADEIDPATGKAYVVDEKTGLTKITMDDINKIRLGSTSLARDDSHQSQIAKTFSDARDYKGTEPLDNPSYRAAAPRLAFSPAPSAPVAAPQ